MTENVLDRVYGCLIGGAIGDALGAPVEGWTYERIWDEYGKVEDFDSYNIPYSSGEPGSVTDDTTMRHYLCLSIVEHSGRVTPEEYADTLMNYLDRDRVWVTEEIAYDKLLAGMNPWECGRGSIPAAVATMSISPIGIVNAGAPKQAYQDGINIASVNQQGEECIAAGTVAAGVAAALAPGATLEGVLETMMEYATGVVYRAIDLTMDLATKADSVDDFVETYYSTMLDWRWPAVEWNREKYHRGEIFSATSLEILPVAMGLIHLCDGDQNQSLVEAASFGRDCDTIATIVGSIVGALNGADSLRDEWKRQCESANSSLFMSIGNDPKMDFESMAFKLVNVLENERRRAVDREQTLGEILNS